jgi:site-specific DNA-methyltransferase (adenine-specific)
MSSESWHEKKAISEVRLMDCMAGMKGFPDNFFDLAIVDPPYGIKANSFGFGKRKGVELTYKRGKNWDDLPPDLAYFLELFRVSKNQIIWGANHFTDKLQPTAAWIFWNKMVPDDVSFAGGELAWTSFLGTLKRIDLLYSGCAGQGVYVSRIHPTQKPIELYGRLLKGWAKQGDKILDTHLGSQSSRIAAYKMGFDFWGFEIDADYFEAGEKRFQDAIAEPLFDSVRPKTVQSTMF